MVGDEIKVKFSGGQWFKGDVLATKQGSTRTALQVIFHDGELRIIEMEGANLQVCVLLGKASEYVADSNHHNALLLPA